MEVLLVEDDGDKEEERRGVGDGGRMDPQTIFLMLGRLKLPALRCFWT